MPSVMKLLYRQYYSRGQPLLFVVDLEESLVREKARKHIVESLGNSCLEIREFFNHTITFTTTEPKYE